MGLQVNNLSALNYDNEVSATIDNNFIYDIERASISSNNEIYPTFTEIDLEADNMLEIFPNQINTEATFYLNPNIQNSNLDFLYPEFTLEANLNIKIPLQIISNQLTFIDTSSLNISDNPDYEIQKVYLNIENGFPLEAEIKIILLDENNMVIDTLISNTKVNSAQVDINNFVINSRSTSIEIDYKDFDNVNKLIAISSLTTKPNNEFVSLYSSYIIDIRLSAKINKLISN